MLIHPDQCYAALLTHDARFDGRFYVGVKTTRIYCRPICAVKKILHTDLGICKALGTTRDKEILRVAEAWRPWRAYASLQIWNQLSKKS